MSTLDQGPIFARNLKRLLSRTRRRVLLHGLMIWLATGLGALLLAVWVLGGVVDPGPIAAAGLAISWVLGILALAGKRLLLPYLRLRSGRHLVHRVERIGAFGNILVAAEEACRRPERWPDNTAVAGELRRRLQAKAVDILDILDVSQIYPLWNQRVARLSLVLILIVGAVSLQTVPQELQRGAARLYPPWGDEIRLQLGGLYAEQGTGYVVAGQDLTVTAIDFAAGDEPTVCEIRVGSGLWQPLHADRLPVLSDRSRYDSPYRKWKTVVPDVRENLSWRFRRGTLITEARPVDVRYHPLVTQLSARVIPPAYTQLAAMDLPRLPTEFEVPAGTTLALTGQVNHPVGWAALAVVGGDTLRLAQDSLSVSGQVVVDTALVFNPVLVDAYGLVNQSPLQYHIIAAEDEVPLVKLERQGDDGILPISGQVQVQVDSADDFGVSTLSLSVRTLTVEAAARESEALSVPTGSVGVFWSQEQPVMAAGQFGAWQEITTDRGPLRVRAKRTDTSESNLRLGFDLEIQAEQLDLVAGDALILMAEAADNRRPLPAGVGRSHRLHLVLPSAADVLVRQAQEGQDQEASLEEMRRRGRALGDDLDRLARELLKNPLPDWARQQEMEAAIERQQALQDELGRVAEQLQQNLDTLAESALTSPQMLDKADELSQLLNQSGSDQMNDLLDKLQKSSDQASPKDVADAIREVAKHQKDMARRLDAALAMLKRMAQEQQMEGLTSLLAQIMQKQQELADLSRQLAEAQAKADATSESEADPEDESSSSQDHQSGESESGKSESTPSESGESESTGSESEQQEGESQTGEQSPSAEELARRQEALAEDLERLKEQLAEALAELQKDNQGSESQASQQMEEALEEALQKMDQQASKNKMDQASEQLQQMDPQTAAQMQQQALRDLGSLYHVLLESQQAMQMAMQMSQVSSLRRLASDLLTLSSRQEEIALIIPAQMQDLRALELTRSQHRLQTATAGVRDQLAELMDESPMRIMQLLKRLDGLIEEMGQGVQSLEDKRGAVARGHASASLAAANNIVIGLLTEAQMNASSASPGGGESQSMSEKLQQMLEQQAGLNGATDELRKMLADRGISQEARSQMQRLGEAQGNLAGRMEELAQEERLSPEGDRLLGDLGELGRDMEWVSGNFEQGLVNDETLRRQERILSRMLDAHNSVRRRDYSSRRESQMAGRIHEEQEGTDGTDGADDQDDSFRLRYQALEKAPAEYRELVRRYFSALDALRRQNAESQEVQ